MTFEVKYRNKQGATEFLRVDAASRSEVFAILKERGIPSAIQVTDVTGKKPRKGTNAGAPMSGSFKGLLALVAVCVIGAVAYLIISQDAPKPTTPAEKKVEKKSIEVVTPEIAPKDAERSVEKKVEEPKRPKKYWEEDVMPPNLSEAQQRKWKHRHLPPPSYTNTAFVTRAKAKYEIFDSHVENAIANLMTLEPGMGLVGSPSYDERTVQEFLKSCEKPIIISEDDDEYQAQLKRDMIQMKIELRDRMAQGDDLVQILTEAHEEAMRLGSIKQQLEQEMRDMIKESQTLDEAQSVVDACNALLEKKGIAPLSKSPLTERYIRRNFGAY